MYFVLFYFSNLMGRSWHRFCVHAAKCSKKFQKSNLNKLHHKLLKNKKNSQMLAFHTTIFFLFLSTVYFRAPPFLFLARVQLLWPPFGHTKVFFASAALLYSCAFLIIPGVAAYNCCRNLVKPITGIKNQENQVRHFLVGIFLVT